MSTFNNFTIDSSRSNSITVEELQRHYPWFSREEIVETMRRFGERRERVLAYLDMKSGHWSYLDLLD